MNITLNERAEAYDGRVRPLITVVGPSGVGKSLLARKIARIITRAEQSPKVLLVDADIFSRGLTARLENGAELKCKYLHDAIVGGHTEMEPIELTEDILGLEEWASLPEEGRVFFLPSIREEARNPFVQIGQVEHSKLRDTLWHAALSGSLLTVGVERF